MMISGCLAPSVAERLSADPKDRIGFYGYITGGRVVFKDVVDRYHEKTNEMFRANNQTPD
jgi:hypothetical protein